MFIQFQEIPFEEGIRREFKEESLCLQGLDAGWSGSFSNMGGGGVG